MSAVAVAGVADLYRAFFDDAPDAVIAVDEQGRIVDANAQTCAVFGYDKEELLEQPVEMLMPGRFAAGHRAHRASFALNGTKRAMGAGLGLWGRRKDGSEFPVDVSLSPLLTSNGITTLAAIRDISARRAAEAALRASELRFRKIFESSPFGMAIVGQDQRLHDVNGVLCELLEYEREALLLRTFRDLTPPEDVTTYAHHLGRLLGGEGDHFSVEKRLVRSDGRLVWVEATFAALAGGGPGERSAVAMIHDITERKNAQARLLHFATHDQLTRLANRSLLIDRLEQVQARSARSGELFAVLFIDLDRFKRVNDELGHAVGDAVLAEVANRITSTMRPSDTCARHGGDEFVVCCDNLGLSEPRARATVATIVGRLLRLLEQPMAIRGHTMGLSSCIGVAIARGTDATAATLIATADSAMYEAKRLGAGHWALRVEPHLANS